MRTVRYKSAALLMGMIVLAALFSDGLERILAHRWFDAYQTLMPRERSSAPAVIVAVDEASLKAHGQWPWPRTVVARLMDIIAAGGPAAIGIDIIFPEADRFSPEHLPDILPDLDPLLKKALTRQTSPDVRMAESLRRGPFVVGFAGLEEGDNRPPPGMTPMKVRGGDPTPHLKNFRGALRSIEIIDAAAKAKGLLSVHIEEGIARRLPLLSSVGEQPVPSLGLALLQLASGTPAVDVQVGSAGIIGIRIGDLFIPTTSDGQMWVCFGPRDGERFISAADVLAGQVDPQVFDRKLVLLGLTGIGLQDLVATPVGERMPGIEVHAQLLENIFENSWLNRPPVMRITEIATLGLLGFILILMTPKLRPGRSALVWAGLITVDLAAGVSLFRFGYLFDALMPALGATAVYGGTMSMTLVMTERQRRKLQRDLAIQREAAARLEGEMEAAKRVQMGMLPAVSSLPVDNRYELAAFMQPARQVGGDLYDFFPLNTNKLFFLVGDVSGKGIEASLFMALSKALCKSVVLRSGNVNMTPAEILTQANKETARDNPETLFVTALAGELDLEIGKVTWATAGHDQPFRLARSGKVEQFTSKPGLPLCVTDEFRYSQESVPLAPGDMLVLITDGVTEAENVSGDFYGSARLMTCLSRLSGTGSAQRVIDGILSDVRGFVGDAVQADDLTLLALCWWGPKGRQPS
jgi:adenylate cyclase